MKAKPVIILFSIAIMSYLGFLLYTQYLLLKQTCVKIVKYTLTGILTKQAALNLVLKITNNSDIDLQANNGKFDVYLNNIYIANVPITITKKLNAKSTIELPLNVYFNPATVIKQGVQSILHDPNNIAITIKGKINVVSNYISINNIKINETIMLSDILKPGNNNNNC